MIRARHLLWSAAILVTAAVVLAACGSDTDKKTGSDTPATKPADKTIAPAPLESEPGTYQTLSIDEFADIVENRAGEYQIINVHIPYQGEVANTDANIPFNDLDALTAAISAKDSPVILYCRSGNMSEQAARELLEQGYTQIWDVPGGMAAWQSTGRDLLDK